MINYIYSKGLNSDLMNYINDEYRKLKLEPIKFSQSDISILLLINSVFEVLSLTEEKNENFKRIKSILSKI